MERTTVRPQVEPLDQEVQRLIEHVATTYGLRYVEEYLVPHLARPLGLQRGDKAGVVAALRDPVGALRVLYGQYGFSRRGKSRDDLAEAALSAVDKVAGLDGPGSSAWSAFESDLTAQGGRPVEIQDRGVVQGLYELAQEVAEAHDGASIVGWIDQSARATGRVEEVFNRIVDIRGLGPKTTSTFVRDMVYILGREDDLEPAEKIHIQPVDRWLRLMAVETVPEPGVRDAADWVIAGKVTKYCRRAGVSSILFSMGCTSFGQRTVREVERFGYEIAKLKRYLDSSAGPRS